MEFETGVEFELSLLSVNRLISIPNPAENPHFFSSLIRSYLHVLLFPRTPLRFTTQPLFRSQQPFTTPYASMNDAHTRETSSPASDPIPSSSRSQPTPSPQQQQQARDVNAVIAGKLADRKSLEFVKDALQQLDMLIYAHFCYMYYLE